MAASQNNPEFHGASIAVVGDYDAATTAHRAIDHSMALAALHRSGLEFSWVATETITDAAKDLARFDAVWCAPRTPYRSTHGANEAIRYARESQRPFLGSCGGFQYAVLEYARAVLNLSEAAHAEEIPDAIIPLIAPLECSMIETEEEVRFEPASRLASAYGCSASREGYHCQYGLNANFEELLATGGLRITARDTMGAPRAFELTDHPFFVGTLFQPERAALHGVVSPIVSAFLDAALEYNGAASNPGRNLDE